MCYKANAGARRLVKGSTEAVGIVYLAVVENLGNPQFLDMAGGLSERLHEQHFDLMLAVASDEQDLDIYDRLFRGGRVDAVVAPNTRVDDAWVNCLLQQGYPSMAFDRTADRSGHDVVHTPMTLPNPPTAIVVDNNLGASACCEGCWTWGLRWAKRSRLWCKVSFLRIFCWRVWTSP